MRRLRPSDPSFTVGGQYNQSVGYRTPLEARIAKKATRAITDIEAAGYGETPVCIAKTQYSLSDDPALLGRPSGFHIVVRDVQLSAGAGFVVALAGEIMTMPGLPKVPSAAAMRVRPDGQIEGLF